MSDPAKPLPAALDPARKGRITASRMIDVLSFDRNGKPLKDHLDYQTQLVVERLGGAIPGIKAKSLSWGNDVEETARSEYDADQGVISERPGFIVHPKVDYVGASPDWLIWISATARRGGESKAPHDSRVHLETILNGMPAEHNAQCQTGMWVCECDEWDFCSFDPRFAAEYRLFIQRVRRDEKMIAKMASECARFNEEVEQIVEEVRKLGPEALRRGIAP